MKPVRIILMLSSLLLLGCGGEGGGTSETTETVTVSPTSISVTAEGGSVSVSISASSAWTAYAADSDADWISVDPAYSSSPKGTLTVKGGRQRYLRRKDWLHYRQMRYNSRFGAGVPECADSRYLD